MHLRFSWFRGKQKYGTLHEAKLQIYQRERDAGSAVSALVYAGSVPGGKTTATEDDSR